MVDGDDQVGKDVVGSQVAFLGRVECWKCGFVQSRELEENYKG